MNAGNILEIRNLHASYQGLPVLRDIIMDVPQKSIVCLVGSNGAGKSSLAKAIIGLAPIASGSISFKGQEVAKLPVHDRIRRRMALVPDEQGLFPEMSVLENLQIGGYLIRDKASINETIDWCFDLFPALKRRIRQNAGSLSGGEQQMATIAKALVSLPELLIMDEPSSGLAPIVIDKVYEALINIRRRGITMLLIEQNVRRSLEISDYCYVIENGSLALEGPAACMKDNETIRALYLGL